MRGIGIVVLLGLILGLVFMLMTFGWVNIKPTQVGVEVNKLAGKINEQPLQVGYHFFNRWKTDIVAYNVSAKAYPNVDNEKPTDKDYTLELKTADGQNVNVDMTIIYALRVKEVPQLHIQVGKNYESEILMQQLRSEARICIGGFTAEEIYQGKIRDTIQSSVKTKLIECLVKYPAIQVNDVLIRHFSFSPAFEQAIEQKKLAAQQVEINKNLALAMEEKSKQMEAEARGGKLKAIQEAQGAAESVKINADAQKYQLEQEAAGNLAKYKAEAEGKRLAAAALGGGQNVVALEFAKSLPPTLKIIGVPIGQNSTSIMDLNGVFKGLFSGVADPVPAAVPVK